MAESDAGVRASVGFCSEKGPRKRNEDFAAAVIGAELPEPRREVACAGADAAARFGSGAEPMALHDRFLLCSDGVHAVLTDDAIAEALRQRSAPDDTARALVAAALDAGSADNCTALVMDVVALPTA